MFICFVGVSRHWQHNFGQSKASCVTNPFSQLTYETVKIYIYLLFQGISCARTHKREKGFTALVTNYLLHPI